MDGMVSQEVLDQCLEAQVEEQTATVCSCPGTHLGNLELRKLSDEFVRRRVNRSASRVANDEGLRRSEAMERREG